METLTLCGAAAYHMLRVPPAALWLAVLSCAEPLRHPSAHRYREARAILSALGMVGPPEVFPTDGMARHHSPLFASRALQPPPASLEPCRALEIPRDVLAAAGLAEMPFELRLPSPEATLLTLATKLGHVRLALLASELMGSFSVYAPPPDLQSLLDRAIGRGRGETARLERADMRASAIQPPEQPWDGHALPSSVRRSVRHGGWSQAVDDGGTPTSLWRRSPVLTPDRLEAFLDQAKGCHGHSILHKAAQLAVANAASPFEAQAAMLLGQPRRRGGEGLGTPLCNKRVNLNPGARAIARQATCYCDLYFRGTDGCRDVDVECHSHAWHDGSERKRILDANRSSALACMGVDVVLLTHEVMRDERAFEAFVELLRERLGLDQPKRTAGLEEARRKLREAVLGFVRWESLGC